MPIILKDQTAEALQACLADAGVTLPVARKIQAAVVRASRLPDDDTTISPALLRRVRERSVLPLLTCVERIASPADGFEKFLFRGEGPGLFEAVRIPLVHGSGAPKSIVCVSSQVGCAMGCAFCATGRLGFTRDLATWEIVEQVAHVRRASPHPVRGVVFMGMGEPLLNLDAVLKAIAVLSEPCGLALAAKAITISTVGIVPGIRRIAALDHPSRLVVSLTSADPATRARLLPVEARYPTPELMEALRAYHAATGRRVTLAWTLLAGINTRPEDARQLAGLLKGLPAQLDLIDVNDPTGRFHPPTDPERNAFRDALRAEVGIPVARRYSGGADIQAACGMLAGRPHARGP